MNINDSIKSKVGVGVDKTLLEKSTSSAAKASKEKSAVAGQTPAGESVTLSSFSAQIKSIENEATAGVFDSDKVDAIKAAISNGQFKVDSEKVADGLIQTVKDLIDSKK
jgi:negative regulator of flagellin synthesis FlgM